MIEKLLGGFTFSNLDFLKQTWSSEISVQYVLTISLSPYLNVLLTWHLLPAQRAEMTPPLAHRNLITQNNPCLDPSLHLMFRNIYNIRVNINFQTYISVICDTFLQFTWTYICIVKLIKVRLMFNTVKYFFSFPRGLEGNWPIVGKLSL